MAISVYTGVMGSGKSYEAILNGVLPAVKSGRRVVTNISGMSEDKIKSYLTERGCKPESLGSVLVVSNEAVLQPGFFPGEARERMKFDVPDWIPLRELQFYADEYVLRQGKSFTKTPFQLILPDLKLLNDRGYDLGSCLVEAAHQGWKNLKVDYFESRPRGEVFAELPVTGDSVVQPGDFVIVDEAWRYWSDECSLTAEHMNFFRMHRHYVGADGVSCDLLVLIQDFASLNRFLRGVCELVLIFFKLKSLGWSSRYRVETYEGKPRKATLVSTSPMQKYKKEIFPLYKSYDGAKGKESSTDDRQNIFKNRWFQIIMIGAVVALFYFGWWFFSYVSRLRNPGADHSKQSVVKSAVVSPVGGVVPGAPGDVSSVVGSAAVVSQSSDVHLLGVMTLRSGETVAVFQGADGRVFRRRMSAGVIDGWESSVGLDGRLVGFSFGSSAGSKK